MIVEGSFNTELFTQFIEDLLGSMQPFPAAKSVIVMDNCAIHKAQQIRDLIESRQVLISYDSACTNVAFKGNEGRVPTSILARFQPYRNRVLATEEETAPQPSSYWIRLRRGGVLVHANIFDLSGERSSFLSSIRVSLKHCLAANHSSSSLIRSRFFCVVVTHSNLNTHITLLTNRWAKSKRVKNVCHPM